MHLPQPVIAACVIVFFSALVKVLILPQTDNAAPRRAQAALPVAVAPRQIVP
jgi:hypothetical protein